MRIGERPRVWAAALLGIAVSATLALLFLQATRFDSSPFFVREAPAEWITYPSAPVPLRPQAELEATFTRRFVLETAPRRAQLALRLYHTGALTINGAPVPFATSDGVGWKRKREGDVAALLRAGENRLEVRVLARSGPPALWLSLEGDGLQLVSDAGWSASLMGAEDAPARLARTPLDRWPRAEPSQELLAKQNPRPLDALRSRAGEIVALFALGAALALAVAAGLRKQRLTRLPTSWLIGAWLLSGSAWLALFAHNRELSGEWGFDSAAHLTYVKVVLQEGRLPLADESWQTYQPPLYYLLSAGWLKLAGLTKIGHFAVGLLRWLGLAAGLLQSLFALLALRELFPERPGLVLCAFVFGASLPASLYLFQLPTNESWVAMLSAGSLWWTIRMLRRGECRLADHAILGLFLGLAMLTKFSALIPLVLCTSVLFFQRWLAEPRSVGKPLARLAVSLAVVLVLCGWHYGRVAMHFGGNPFVGNWDEASGQRWWQDPGYHVRADYTRFGRVLERPLMSATASVPDALYSTLWGDGMLSGRGRVEVPPPWDLERMAAGYLVALGPCLALVLGSLLAFADFVRKPRAERFLMIAVLGATAYALVNMTLRLPYYTQAKAFYGLSALVPLAFCFALGFDALVLRVRWLAPLGVAWLAGWALLAHATFFGVDERLALDPSQAEALVDEGGWIARAEQEIAAGRRDGAIAALRSSLAMDPDQGPVGPILARLLRDAGRSDEALAAARAALRASPAGQNLHMLTGELWLEQGDARRAAFHFGAAARLLPSIAWAHIEAARRKQVETLRDAGLAAEAITQLQELRARGELERSGARLLVQLLLESPEGQRDAALALEIAESLDREAQGRDATTLETLAVAQAANGRAADAAVTQERALALWRASSNASATVEAGARLLEYQRAAAGQRRSSRAASP